MNFKFYLSTTSSENKKHNRPYYVAIFLRGKLRRTSIKIKKYPSPAKRFWISRTEIEAEDFKNSSPDYYKVICDSFISLLNACANPDKIDGLTFRPLSLTKRKLKWKRAYKKLLKHIPICILNDQKVENAYNNLIARLLNNAKQNCLAKNKSAEKTKTKLEKVGKKLTRLSIRKLSKVANHKQAIANLSSSPVKINVAGIDYSVGTVAQEKYTEEETTSSYADTFYPVVEDEEVKR